jgi:hypothetical protein
MAEVEQRVLRRSLQSLHFLALFGLLTSQEASQVLPLKSRITEGISNASVEYRRWSFAFDFRSHIGPLGLAIK